MVRWGKPWGEQPPGQRHEAERTQWRNQPVKQWYEKHQLWPSLGRRREKCFSSRRGKVRAGAQLWKVSMEWWGVRNPVSLHRHCLPWPFSPGSSAAQQENVLLATCACCTSLHPTGHQGRKISRAQKLPQHAHLSLTGKRKSHHKEGVHPSHRSLCGQVQYSQETNTFPSVTALPTSSLQTYPCVLSHWEMDPLVSWLAVT